MLAKTPVIHPCYSAVSVLLTNPLPDRSNYSPLLPHPLPHSEFPVTKQEMATMFAAREGLVLATEEDCLGQSNNEKRERVLTELSILIADQYITSLFRPDPLPSHKAGN